MIFCCCCLFHKTIYSKSFSLKPVIPYCGTPPICVSKAAVDRPNRSGHERRTFVRQKRDHFGDLARLGDASRAGASRCTRRKPIAGFGSSDAAHLSIGVSTVPGQTALARIFSFAKSIAIERVRPDQAVFADGVRQNVLLARERLDRRNIDDRPAALLLV